MTTNQVDELVDADDDVKQAEIVVGTSGFSYGDWVGRVYPDDIKKEKMLSFYASDLGFRLVELNDTYNTVPVTGWAENLLNDVTAGFAFVVKAHKSMTRNIYDRDGAYIRDEEAVEAFMAGVNPLVDANALKCIIAQFPVRFARSDGAFAHIKWLAGSVAPVPLVVEFRNINWMAKSAFDKLHEIGVGYCSVDGPELPEFPNFTPAGTAPVSCVRLCGRNKNWFDVKGSARYDYNYSNFELKQLTEPIRKIAETSADVIVLFNNYTNGASVKNAKILKELLPLG
ncbi:hypothetical protein MNBD_NITROSPINAE01-48 [hydrothermal vent metagenome]|uniref:DUF72 domain-containing protein n=1 Tax=hydrothermal vent metagenome TaxID=652676 RepID=A0A3B1CI15_9ZZZZ